MGLINATDTFNLKGEPVDKNDAADTTGIYESPDGVRHFIKAGRPVPADWQLADQVAKLNARPEVVEAQDGNQSEPDTKPKGGRKSQRNAPKNKAESVPEDKADDSVDGDEG